MDQYEIIDEDYREKGPFSLKDIECMVERKVISRKHEVMRLGDEETVSADYALIFHGVGESGGSRDDASRSSGSQIKVILGVMMCIVGLGVGGLVFQAVRAEKYVKRRHIVIAVVLTLAGVKVIQSNLPESGA